MNRTSEQLPPVETLREHRRAGETLKEIGERYEVSPEAVYAVLREPEHPHLNDRSL